MRNVRERDVERYFCAQVKKRGGKAYKWVSPGNRGVPDRIVFLYTRVHFIELKASWGALSAPQLVQFKKLVALGVSPITLSTKDSIDNWLWHRDDEEASRLDT